MQNYFKVINKWRHIIKGKGLLVTTWVSKYGWRKSWNLSDLLIIRWPNIILEISKIRICVSCHIFHKFSTAYSWYNNLFLQLLLLLLLLSMHKLLCSCRKRNKFRKTLKISSGVKKFLLTTGVFVWAVRSMLRRIEVYSECSELVR